MKRRIVIADSDRQSTRLIKNILIAAGYETASTNDLSDCHALVSVNSPDILIIDPLFPDSNGIKAVRQICGRECCEIIAVSENSGERAISEIFKAGADDYIKKPFLSSELLARVNASIRRIERLEKASGLNTSAKYLSGGLEIDFDRHNVVLDGEKIHLTKNEFKILTLLCRYSGRVLTYDFIIKSVWGPEVLNGNGILRVNITNLRKKIEHDSTAPIYLFTENGVGYRIAENCAEN